MVNERLSACLGKPSCSVAQAADVLGLSRQGVLNAIHRGDIRATRIGRRIVVPTAPLRKMLMVDDAGAKALNASAA